MGLEFCGVLEKINGSGGFVCYCGRSSCRWEIGKSPFPSIIMRSLVVFGGLCMNIKMAASKEINN